MNFSAKLIALFALLMAHPAIAKKSNYRISVHRYEGDDCTGKQIHSTVDIHNNKCKNFSDEELPFGSYRYSYGTIIMGHNPYKQDNGCAVTAYEDYECGGEGDAIPATANIDVCVPFPAGGRSISVTCDGNDPDE